MNVVKATAQEDAVEVALEDVGAKRRQAADYGDLFDDARGQYHAAIRRALAAGVKVTTLMEKTGYSRPRIYQIRDEA